MKTLNFIFTLLISASIWGQCPTGNVTLASQSDVNNFINNYSSSCNSVNGALTIGIPGTISDISDISGLLFLESISGNFIVQYCPQLTDLSGLDNLADITGGITIGHNTNLVSISSLSNVTSTENVAIYYNESLQTISGIENIINIDLNLQINNNNLLIDISDLNSNLSIGQYLIIYNNPSLSQCEAEAICDYLASPNGTVTIVNNNTGCNSQSEVQAACVPTTQLQTTYCNTTLSSFTQGFYVDQVGASSYEFRFEDQANPGTYIYKTGSGFGTTMFAAGITQTNATYNVQIRALVNGIWGNYGPICTLTTPASLPSTQLQPVYCNSSLSSFSQGFYVTSIGGVSQYNFRFEDQASPGTYIYKLVNGYGTNMLAAGITQTNAVYNVSVAANFNGTWGPFGSVCTLSTPASLPSTQLRAQDCNSTMSSFTQVFYVQQISGATQYRFRFEDPANPGTYFLKTVAGYGTNLTGLGISDLNVTYNADVAAYFNGVWGPYGTLCTVTSPSSSSIVLSENSDKESNIHSLEKQTITSFGGELENSTLDEIILYPNPFDNQLNLDKRNCFDEVEISVYNTLGQKMFHSVLSDKVSSFDLSNLEPGIYLFELSTEDQNKTLRIVKQ